MLFARRKQYFARIFNNKFIQGGYTLYERDHFTCHDPPEYPSAPSAGVAGTGRYGKPSGDSALPRLRWGEYVCVQSVSYSRGIPKNGRSIPGSYDIMSV